MTKLLSTLTLAFFATVAFNAHAASHAGGAPMKKASEPAAKASAPMKDEKKAEEKKK
jgi:hypothetical protein